MTASPADREPETMTDEEIGELALALGTQLAALADLNDIHPWHMAQALGVCVADALRACDREQVVPAWRAFADVVAEALIRPESGAVN